MMSPIFTSGTSIDYAESNPSFMVRVGNATSGSFSSAFTYSGGSSWYSGTVDVGGTTGGGTVAAAADASCVVWAPVGGQVSYSTATGSSWTQCSGGVPSGALVRSYRVNAKKFYAFSNGIFYVSTNGGQSFTASAATLPTAGTFPEVFRAMIGVEGDIRFAGTDGSYHSTDSGTTFTKLSTGVTEADMIGFGKAARPNLYGHIHQWYY